MTILQNIIWPIDSLERDDANLYFRSANSVALDGSFLLIKPYSSVKFNTYLNVFSATQWFVNCDLKSVRISGRYEGSGRVEVFKLIKDEFYSHESCVASIELKSEGNEFSLDLQDIDKTRNQVLYINISTGKDRLLVKNIEYKTYDLPRQEVILACCICTFNRKQHLKKIIEEITAGRDKYRQKVNIFISNNGDEIDFNTHDAFIVKNRNLGGAGGFARALDLALNTVSTHVVFMDDDISINYETIYRTIRLFEYLVPSRRDIFLSGAMLSSEQKWFQYERNTLLHTGQFHHQGFAQDLRAWENVIENATAKEIYGQALAGWWYCAVSTKMIQDYGYPLPIFVRGDDIEFALRCSKRVVSLNGVCVWHDPFIGKYSELMEDYYLVRNMLINNFLYFANSWVTIKNFVVKKFIKNIVTMNYVAAEMNILAIKHLINASYRRDSADLHMEISKFINEKKKNISYEKKFRVYPRSQTSIRLLINALLHVLMCLMLYSGGKGGANYGFARSIRDFLGKKEVSVYIPQMDCCEIAKLERIRMVKLIGVFIFNMYLFFRYKSSIKIDIFNFREEASRKSNWLNIWRR
jgi:galactofuranosylgalactofuranosylrhamnosyl-N-acetylglucosaminyl-diphospho-decaprenol beta-1,5/1,6-galactofuranosyltransferase